MDRTQRDAFIDCLLAVLGPYQSEDFDVETIAEEIYAEVEAREVFDGSYIKSDFDVETSY